MNIHGILFLYKYLLQPSPPLLPLLKLPLQLSHSETEKECAKATQNTDTQNTSQSWPPLTTVTAVP